MDFPAFSSICSSNKAECDVNAGWISVVFCSSCRFVWGILCRWEDEERKRQRVKETKSQREEESKRQKDKETKRQKDKKTKSQKDKETKRGRDEGTRRRKPRHLLFTSYSPPIRVLFTASSPPNSFKSYSIRVQKHLRDSCPKQFYTIEHRFVRVR